jgi:hypothetical protein
MERNPMEMGDYENLKSLSEAATWMALFVTKLKLK